ncbi:general transcription factor IIIA, b isoform X1 [Anarhichas minor]|uniref:general transcription factor IIIA, b isoform X1 n=1 Tax=Anarhichas minor TaxID=65739 RepID=UPI003F738A94
MTRERPSGHIITVHVFLIVQLTLVGLCVKCFPNFRNRSPVRTVTRAFALVINSPDTRSITVGRNHTSKPLYSLFETVKCNLCVCVERLPALVSRCLADGCSEVFVTNASMKNHMARVHQHQEKRYQCDHQGCGRDFNKRNQLKAHKCEQHQLLLFRCTISGCTRELPSNGKLKHHVKVHEGYPCEVEACPFQGKTWTEYLKHRKEHKVKVPCGECEKLFNNAWFLRQHELRVHSGERRKLLCPKRDCGKKFTRRFNLENHVLGDHEGKKPFSCAYAGCEKSFAMKESLWRHGAVHDPAKKKLKKLHPKKNQPWRLALQVSVAAAAERAETNELAEELRNTTLKDETS